MTQRIVIKIGGATFFQPDGFADNLRSQLIQNQDSQVWLVVGGGDLVEAMRTAHRIYSGLNEEDIHWRCVELLDHTWALAMEISPIGISIRTPEDLALHSRRPPTPGVFWVRVQSFYNRADCQSIPINLQPRSNWSTTTDSLAWLLAKTIDADRVLLIKQCECSPDWTFSQAAGHGVIDSELARLIELNPSARPSVQLVRIQSE